MSTMYVKSWREKRGVNPSCTCKGRLESQGVPELELRIISWICSCLRLYEALKRVFSSLFSFTVVVPSQRFHCVVFGCSRQLLSETKAGKPLNSTCSALKQQTDTAREQPGNVAQHPAAEDTDSESNKI